MGPAPPGKFAPLGNSGVLDALMEDGKQHVHNDVVKRIFDAIID